MLQAVQAPRRARLRDGINHVAYSPDGGRVAYSDVHMNVVLPGEVSINLTSPNDKVRPTERIRDLVFARDGLSVYATAGDHVWQLDAQTAEEKWRYMPPRAWGFLIISPLALAISSSNDLAVSTDNGQILAWNSEHSLISKIGTNETQRRIVFAGKSNELVTLESFAVNRFDIETGRRTARHPLSEKAYGMAISPIGDMAVVRTLSQILMLDLTVGKVTAQFGVGAGLPLVAFHPMKPLIAIGEDTFVSLRDFNGRVTAQIEVEGAEVISMTFRPDGRCLSIGCSDHTIHHQQL